MLRNTLSDRDVTAFSNVYYELCHFARTAFVPYSCLFLTAFVAVGIVAQSASVF